MIFLRLKHGFFYFKNPKFSLNHLNNFDNKTLCDQLYINPLGCGLMVIWSGYYDISPSSNPNEHAPPIFGVC